MRHFWKYQGTGNDFIILDERGRGVKATPPPRDDVIAWCDRHFGVGADGVLSVLPPLQPGHAARMHITNADGSVPEMCGNGLRCVALYLVDSGVKERVFTVETDAGPRGCTVGPDGEVTLSMGRVRVGVEAGFTQDAERIVDGKRVRILPVDVGNPHLVMDTPPPEMTLAERLGPLLVKSEGFPNGTNVEWISVEQGKIRALVFERGVGITLACGTGAVACAFAAEHWGLVKVQGVGSVPVEVPGGVLRIGRAEDGQATLTGPARRVFSGELP